jgi:hypothetical protein
MKNCPKIYCRSQGIYRKDFLLSILTLKRGQKLRKLPSLESMEITSAYQPTLKDLKSIKEKKKMQLRQWYFFRIFISLCSIWIGFILYPMLYSFNLIINPLDGIRNGNVIVFVAVLCSASMGLFWDTKRAFTWHIGRYHFLGLFGVLFVSAIHIPFFTLQQTKDSPKTVVYIVSIILFLCSVWLAKNTYLMTLLDQEPLNEEEEREAEESYDKAKQVKKVGDIEI